MERKTKTVKTLKYVVICLFLLFSIISVRLISTIAINYNISDYLDEATDTKISLGIMEEEFGLISNVQVMVKDVSPEEAEEIKSTIKTIENIIFVNFSAQNTDYYKDGDALFVVLVDGNEYSDTAKEALTDIEEALSEKYGERLQLGGTVMEKKLLRAAIQGEIMMILAISICLVAVLMLITAASWIEPLVLLAASGVAVLLNMGTNAIFGEISYITNAIAAILQLALSMDYSIVLLHSYREHKKSADTKEIAMLSAIKEVVKPVSASALTTIAGLLALLFMSFTIGFDIGSVLMKSIVISALTSLTLLPALLLIFDRLMVKTAKRDLKFKGEKIANASLKAGKFIVPIALILVAVCCVVNFSARYNFVDSSNSNPEISETFGDSGTLIVLFKNCEDAEEKEKLLL
ncbi:MAG: MMPL family transporter, partial [Clostridia bacterium]|nr:MMPL family transporter [Clostridia bacterium]